MAHLEGVRVLEFSHMVMGPTVGMILADLGAEVIKVEPLGGDKTR
ncbi:MAG: CoA transferase, partial [Betaproteobacteria bacterium]|nr:CoA transferase [Betaproteobacteria bacterium]